jgi:hypothetical protein
MDTVWTLSRVRRRRKPSKCLWFSPRPGPCPRSPCTCTSRCP